MFSPLAATVIAAQPVGRSALSSRASSTPSARSSASAASAKASVPTAPTSMTRAPDRFAASA
jgi:hypothetical protein